MAMLCKLADPGGYQSFDWEFIGDRTNFEYWLDLFASFPATIERYLRADGLGGGDFERRWEAFRREYGDGIAARRREPHRYALNTLRLTEFRQLLLLLHGWPDPYLRVKHRENEAAVRLYPEVVRAIDATPSRDRWATLFRGVFAGNMFDLGAPETIELYERGELDYHQILARLRPRPWFIDDADAMTARLTLRERYRQALLFVDNAGTDIVLGVLPLARELARGGTRVVLAANSEPALNDITIGELNPLLDQIAELDPIVRELREANRLATVDSGNGTPLIDLGGVSNTCNAEAYASDLIVLEGMGRGVESNWRQRFSCDVWRIALIKDEAVARWVGCRMFDPICRFNAAEGFA